MNTCPRCGHDIDQEHTGPDGMCRHTGPGDLACKCSTNQQHQPKQKGTNR